MKSCNSLRALLTLGSCLALIACSAASDSHDHDHEETHNSHTHDTEHGHDTQVKSGEKKPKSQSATTRSADSHVHGGATLSIVTEKNSIFIEFETPLFNLLGFEYEPKSVEEKTHVHNVETKLANPDSLFRLNKEAKCSFNKLGNKPHLFKEELEEHDEAHDHEDTEHKDVILRYALDCKSVEKIKSIEVLFFKDFSHLSELELIYLGSTRQMSAELSPSKPSVDLTR